MNGAHTLDSGLHYESQDSVIAWPQKLFHKITFMSDMHSYHRCQHKLYKEESQGRNYVAPGGCYHTDQKKVDLTFDPFNFSCM